MKHLGWPAGYEADDIYLCQSKYSEDGKLITRVKSWRTTMTQKAEHSDDTDLVRHPQLLQIKKTVPSIYKEPTPPPPTPPPVVKKVEITEPEPVKPYLDLGSKDQSRVNSSGASTPFTPINDERHRKEKKSKKGEQGEGMV